MSVQAKSVDDFEIKWDIIFSYEETEKLSCDWHSLETLDQRIQFLFETPALQKIKIHPKTEQKSGSQSEELRQAGNEHMKHGALKQALAAYNLSLLYAPHPSSDDSSSSLTAGSTCATLFNRAVCLYKWHRYRESLNDLNTATLWCTSDALLQKMQDMTGKVLKELSHVGHDTDNLACGDGGKQPIMILDSNPGTADVQVADGGHVSDEEDSKQMSKIDPKFTLSMSAPRNNDYPPASAAIGLSQLPNKGRGFVAKEDIAPGTVVIMEEFFAAVPFKLVADHHCYNCLRKTETFWPCEHCAIVFFCSQHCATQATWHKTECTYAFNIKHAPEALRIANRIVLKAGYKFLMEHREKLEHAMDTGTLICTPAKGLLRNVRVGKALAPTVSLVNHSCFPNCDIFTTGNQLVIRAVRAIKTGEEITICYKQQRFDLVPLGAQVLAGDRQQMLWEQYYFMCKCQGCEQNWPKPITIFTLKSHPKMEIKNVQQNTCDCPTKVNLLQGFEAEMTQTLEDLKECNTSKAEEMLHKWAKVLSAGVGEGDPRLHYVCDVQQYANSLSGNIFIDL
ncbi:unnamed protein product [Notodromas monacha]|uniref:SET domain-containing protein n=1 Tax=Notodromas monacha TaxID=399045 RepID=A0A7R9BSX7_9CRUS|nr:unnamed protein product [Notodromas monacha]CAG0919730.1 unnamed protein product [Notodromas monacha]